MDKHRLKKLQASLKNPILIKKHENLYYLTGHIFDAHAQEYLLVRPTRMNTDKKRIKTDVVGFSSGLEKIDWVKKVDRLKNIGNYLKPKSELGIEWGFTLGEAEYLRAKGRGLRVMAEVSPVDRMRQVKDAEELSRVRKSMQIVEKVFAKVKNQLKKKTWTEEGLAKFITEAGFKLGAEDVSFPAIVASGANASIPHHVPSLKRLKPGETIIIDFGFKYRGYCSDFTRTVFLGNAPKKLAEAYIQTEKAYKESIKFASAGEFAEEVYLKSVEILAETRLDKYFIHSLGHGTGLEIHELPNLSPNSKDILQNNMVFSIEPGVYFPKQGGIRIEDLVYLEEGRVKKFINVSTRLEDNII
jgi:Xaa-Pro aminopeptidase